MSNRIELGELETYLYASADILRGHVDASEYKSFIFPLLFFKRICDIYDEETQAVIREYGEDGARFMGNSCHRFIIPEKHHWNDIRGKTENIGVAIQNAFYAVEQANEDSVTHEKRLLGVFGTAPWANKNRLPDEMLKNLIEHFSKKTLNIETCPEDELGQAYEYLIKKFGDDSGHTSQEFYTNRTVVHLMTEILKPQPGETVYDPTCGSAGMLISCIHYLREHGAEWRGMKCYGQEINPLSASIGKMNLFLNGVSSFSIVNADTLKNPAFLTGNRLQQFDIVLANPPYSISEWNRDAFESDVYGRNKFGTPPQSRADYAFIQHILSSLNPRTGRGAVLLPHGVLNRNEEKDIRKAIVQSDCIDAVIGLGRHLFYNSGLESCVIVFQMNKPIEHRNSVLFIEAEKCTHKIQSQNYLFDEDIEKICHAYLSDENIENFSYRASMDEILANDGNLNIKMYVNSDADLDDGDFSDNLDAFISSSVASHKTYTDPKAATDSPFKNCSVAFEGFDKSAWTRVKLSDVAEEYSERVDDPSQSDYEWYIGSDCIDGFDYRIKRKEPASKVHSAQKAFHPGDYLLVRRSLYGSDFRERAPRADFEGTCSADILTIREKPGKVADGYLIAILYSRQLWKFIVSNSTGSLTRRIKWNQLKDFEFDLPPLALQEELVQILWAMEDAKDAYRELIAKTDEYVKSQFIEMFVGKGYPLYALSEVCSKITDGTHKTPDYKDNGVVFISAKNVSQGFLDLSDVKYITRREYEEIQKRCQTERGDVILSKSGTLGVPAIVDTDIPLGIFESLAVLKYDRTRIDGTFLKEQLRSEHVQKELLSGVKGVAVKHLHLNVISSTQISVPPLAEQKQFAAFVEQSDKSKFEAQQALNYLTNTQKSLMRQYLGE